VLGTNPAGATAPSAPMDRYLADYVIFATDMIHSKGSDTNSPIQTQFLGGSIGINNTGELAGSLRMTVCNADDHPILMDDNTQLNADSMKLTAGCNVWDVYSNDVTYGGGPAFVPGNSGPNAATFPIIDPSDLPTIPSFACNGNDVLSRRQLSRGTRARNVRLPHARRQHRNRFERRHLYVLPVPHRTANARVGDLRRVGAD
jgi:hypothetical protein